MASKYIPTQPSLVKFPFCADGNKNNIPETNSGADGLASYSKGFPPITEQPVSSGGIPPVRRDFNGILYALSAFCFFSQSGGIYTYNAQANYTTPAIVFYDNTIWFCMRENGANSNQGVHAPGSSTNYWVKFIDFLLESAPPLPPFLGINSTGTSDHNYDGGGASGLDAIAIGKTTYAIAKESVAIGKSALASMPSSVAIGESSTATESNEFSVGNSNARRRITNVANGVNTYDAVNKGQLPYINADAKNRGYLEVGGLLIEWGKDSFGSSPDTDSHGNYYIDIDPPKTFTSSVYSVVATDRLAESAALYSGLNISWDANSSANDKLRFVSTSSHVQAFCWVAIGK